MAVEYIGPSQRYSSAKLRAIGFESSFLCFFVSLIGAFLLALLGLSISSISYFVVLVIGWLFSLMFVFPTLIGLMHRLGVVTFSRFVQLGFYYSIMLTLYVGVLLIVFGAVSGSPLDLIIGGAVFFAASWVAFSLSWMPIRLFTNQVQVAEPGHCTSCNYNLRGAASDTCPECGNKIQIDQNCVGCGYDLTGLESDRCPECGVRCRIDVGEPPPLPK